MLNFQLLVFNKMNKLKCKNILKTKHSTIKTFVFFLILNTQYSVINSQTNRILFIFDDSYSMYAPWNINIKI